MSNPKISVITTVYNVGQYIEKTIESMLSQSFKDWEMLLVNDCTQDDSVEKIMKYDDPRLVLINNEVNVGAGKARQVGIDNAKGEFILFLDGDDWLSEACLEKLYNTAIEKDADIVNCWVKEIDDYGLINPLIKADAKERFTTYLGNKLIRKSLFNLTHYSPLRLYEDINTLFRLLELTDKVVKINYVGYNYNVRPNSLTTKPYQHHKWLVYNTLAIMENVDFFEGKKIKSQMIYNVGRVFKFYYGQIVHMPERYKKELINEIETIRVWCEKHLGKIK